MRHRSRAAAARLFVTAVLVLASATGRSAEEGPVRTIGSRRELFVDHWLIDGLRSAELRLHHPVPRETVLRFDQPWEGRFVGYVTVLKDGDRFRLYYRGYPDVKKGARQVTCYAESRDGIRFTRPTLGLHEHGGSRDNNIILADVGDETHNFSPFLDARAGVPPAQRFKAVGGSHRSGLVAYVSADGIHWTRLRNEPIITEGAFDSQNLAFWSESEDCYVCYFRVFVQGVRSISRTTSKDFLTWTEPRPMSFGDTPMEHLYTNQTQPYSRAPHIYVATPARFFPGRRVLTPEQAKIAGVDPRYFKDCSDNVLMTSRGGTAYDRTFMEAFIRPGVGLGNWGSRSNYPALGIVPTGPAEMSIYIQRHYAQPTAHLQRCALRTDGFVSVHAGYKGGEMVTRPLTFTGRQLEVNVSTSAAGALRVELQDAGGTPIPGHALDDCLPVIGDDIERVVIWKAGSDVGALAGKPIRLRFVLQDADLYAIRFR